MCVLAKLRLCERMASYFRPDIPRPFSGNDRRLGTTKRAPAAPSSRILAGKKPDLFRSCIFQLRSRPETRRHSACISSSVGATNESVSIYCCSVPGSGDVCLKFLKDSLAVGHRAGAILTTQNMLQNAQDI